MENFVVLYKKHQLMVFDTREGFLQLFMLREMVIKDWNNALINIKLFASWHAMSSDQINFYCIFLIRCNSP